MAKEKSKPASIDGEYIKPDVERAFTIHKQSIAPKMALMAEKRGDTKEPWKEIKDECRFPKKVLEFLLFIDDLDDAKADHFRLALSLGAEHLGWRIASDLVTLADGTAGNPLITIGNRIKPRLVTVSDGTETDLADIADDIDKFDVVGPVMQAAE